MEERMTICNMTIEGGGRAGMIAPDETTFEWVQGRPGAPEDFEEALALLAHAADRRGRDVRPRDHRRRGAISPAGHLGHEPRPGRRRRRRGARAEHRDRRALARLHGPGGGHADQRAQARPRLHRLLHQRPDRRPARRRGDDQGPQGRVTVERDGRPGLGAGGQAGRGRGPRRDLPRGRLRLAHRGLLDVPGHEPGHLEPGERCASTSNRNFEGRQGRGGRTHLVSPRWPPPPRSRATSSTSGSGTSHGTRSSVITGPVTSLDARRRRHRPDHPQAVPQADRAHRLRRVPVLRLGAGARLGAAREPDPRDRAELRLRLEPRARPVGAAGLRLPGDRRVLASPTSSSPTARRSACCRSCCRRRTCRR